MEAHQQRETDGNVRVARKVCIYLQRIKEEGSQVLKSGEEHRIGKDAVYEVQSQIVAQYNLLRQTSQYHEYGKAKHSATKEITAVELGNEVAGLNDGTCYKLREETDVKTEVEDVANRLYQSSIDIGRVTDDLEGVERYSDWQDDSVNTEYRNPRCCVEPFGCNVSDLDLNAEDLPDNVGKEVTVLEIAKNAEVEHHAQSEPQPLLPPLFEGIDALCDEEVAASYQQKKSDEQPACFVIEKQAHSHQVSISQMRTFLHQSKAGKDDAEEHPEMHLGEEQRTVLVEREYIPQVSYE